MPRAGKAPLTAGLHKQTLTFAGAVLAQLPMLSEERQQHYIGKPDHLKKVLQEAFANDMPKVVITADLVRLAIVYEKLYGQTPDWTKFVISPKPEGQGPMRLIAVAKEIVDWTGGKPLQGTQDSLRKHFPCWQYEKDLDEAIVKNDRDPRNGSYTVWVKDVREADEEYAGKSANDLAASGPLGITILERQLLEMDYFLEHGEHIDLKNWTMCAGSRDRDGRVPDACWNGSEFGINLYAASNRSPYLRSRRVWI